MYCVTWQEKMGKNGGFLAVVDSTPPRVYEDQNTSGRIGLNMLLFTGLIIFRIFFLKIEKDSAPLNSGPMPFQEITLSG